MRFPPGNESLRPVVIEAMVEVTKLSKPSMERVALGNSASRQAVTRVNAEQAPKTNDVGADPTMGRGRPLLQALQGATGVCGPTGAGTDAQRWSAMACLHKETSSNTRSPSGGGA